MNPYVLPILFFSSFPRVAVLSKLFDLFVQSHMNLWSSFRSFRSERLLGCIWRKSSLGGLRHLRAMDHTCSHICNFACEWSPEIKVNHDESKAEYPNHIPTIFQPYPNHIPKIQSNPIESNRIQSKQRAAPWKRSVDGPSHGSHRGFAQLPARFEVNPGRKNMYIIVHQSCHHMSAYVSHILCIFCAYPVHILCRSALCASKLI